MVTDCPCLGTGYVHVTYGSRGDYVITHCPNCPVPLKSGRPLGSVDTVPRKRRTDWIKRRKKSNYVSNSGDLA